MGPGSSASTGTDEPDSGCHHWPQPDCWGSRAVTALLGLRSVVVAAQGHRFEPRLCSNHHTSQTAPWLGRHQWCTGRA